MKELTKEELQKKLRFLGLNLNNVPSKLMENVPFNFDVKEENINHSKVFRFVPINKIDILITSCQEKDPLVDRFSNALPLNKFLLPEERENYTKFLKMLNKVTIEEIQEIAILQEKIEADEKEKINFINNTWQIYYIEEVDKYFMLVSIKDKRFAEFFYLLKEKIEMIKTDKKVAPKIFVPVYQENYVEEFLNEDDIEDLETCLKLFTKNEVMVFENYSKSSIKSLEILGQVQSGRSQKLEYFMKFTDKENASKFYKLLKAIYLIQTEINNHYSFTTKVEIDNSLGFYYGEDKITYETLADFIKEEFLSAKEKVKNQNEDIIELEQELGKDVIENDIDEDTSFSMDMDEIKELFSSKKYYTIEDLISIYEVIEEGERYYKKLKEKSSDRSNLEKAVSNSKQEKNTTIQEKSKKGLFNFWKFSNKTENLGLEPTPEQEIDEEEEIEEVEEMVENNHNMQYLDNLRKKILNQKQLIAKSEKGRVRIRIDEENRLFHVILPVNKFNVILEKDEYKVYANNSKSYIIADQPNIRIMYKKLYLYIERKDEIYYVITNQNIQFSEKTNGLTKEKDVISFYAKNLAEIKIENDILKLKCNDIDDNILLKDNRTLLISEEKGKVYLPYTEADLREDMKTYSDLSVSEIIEKKYTNPIKIYKNSMVARFREAYDLMYNRENRSFKDSVLLGIELMFEFNLHPAIISACKKLEELDIYLDCLDDNELDKFSCFKIIYRAMPSIAKNRMQYNG